MHQETPGSEAFARQVGLSAHVFQRIVALRRDLHRHPELSWQEERTAGRIAAQLEELGVAFRTGVAGTGVVAEIPGEHPQAPAVALRADTDALPIQEETGLPFASQVAGVMHACGHDGHTSMLMGAAALLAGGTPPPAPVRLLWQPAEEKGAGAKALIEAGVLEGVGMIFGGHVDRRYAAGDLVVTEGPVNAASDMFSIRITGQQGHGARPHEAVDAVVVGSLLVTAIQTIVSREVDPSFPSVISVGRFTAGTAPNVIAGTATLAGTIRTQHRSVRDHLAQALTRIARAVGDLHQAQVSVEVRRGTPALVNSGPMTRIAREAAEAVVGAQRVVPLRQANMGAEDFAYYLQHVPGCYIRFGGRIAGCEGFPAHSSRFDFDEQALASGAAWFAEVARRAGRRLIAGGS